MRKVSIVLLAVMFCVAAGAAMLYSFKAPAYYMDQVIAAINSPSAGLAEIERAYVHLAKARKLVKDKELIIQRAEDLAESAERKGIIQARELQLDFIRDTLSEDPGNWNAREILIKSLAERGDLAGLADEVANLDKLVRISDDDWNYCIKTAQLFAVSASVPWIQSEAFLNLNKSPSAFIEKTAVYLQAVRQAENIEHDMVVMLGSDPSLKKAPPASLVSAAQLASADILGEKDTISRARKFVSKLDNDDAFRNAVQNALEGNVALAGRKYADARAKYRSALALYPYFPDVKKQSAETDFQEGVALIAAEETNYRGKRLLRGAYKSINELIDEAEAYGPQMPFVEPARFSGEAWCLKAAVISAMRASYSSENKSIKVMEAEFKEALDQALKLNPNSLLARQLLDRYSKEGF